MSAKRDKTRIKQIAKNYVRNGFKLQEAMKAIDNVSYKGNGQAVMACRLKYTPEYIEAVKTELAKFDKSLVNEQFVIVKLYELIEDNSVKASDKVNCLGLIAKILQMTKEQGNTNNLAIFGDVLGELRAVSVKSMPKAEPTIAKELPIDTTTTDVTPTTPSS